MPSAPCRLAPAGLLLLAACGAPDSADTSRLVDHHVHLLSPALVKDWKSLGVNFSRPDSVYTSASALLGDTAIADGGPARQVAGAVLIPMAHLYGRQDIRGPLRLSLAAEQAAVRRENDYVAAEAARFPDRAIALCGVDFLRPYAWSEVQRCRAELQSPGIKLHLASAGANLGYASHLAALRRYAELASADSLILFVHFDPQNNRGNLADIRRFIAEVLQPFPDLTVVIAHLGGSGGFDAWTRAIFETFTTWLDEEAAAGRPRTGVHFDISAVWLARDSEGMPRSTKQDAEALAAELARVGVGRLLFGSDAPVFIPGPYAAAFRRQAALSAEAWDSLARNRLPGLPSPP